MNTLIYRKATRTDQYLHYESYHHLRIKSGIIICPRTRVEMVWNVNKEKEHLCKMFVARRNDQKDSTARQKW